MSRLRMWRLTLAWAALIVVVTVVPARSLAAPPVLPGMDKLVHAALFLVLTWLALHARSRDQGPRMPLWLVLGAVALFAGVDEWIQQFVPGRDTDVLDWVADMAGALLALWIFGAAPVRREMTS